MPARYRVQEFAELSGVTVKAGQMKQWAARRHWSRVERWGAEGLHMMSFERFERAADFIDRAVQVRAKFD